MECLPVPRGKRCWNYEYNLFPRQQFEPVLPEFVDLQNMHFMLLCSIVIDSKDIGVMCSVSEEQSIASQLLEYNR